MGHDSPNEPMALLERRLLRRYGLPYPRPRSVALTEDEKMFKKGGSLHTLVTNEAPHVDDVTVIAGLCAYSV